MTIPLLRALSTGVMALAVSACASVASDVDPVCLDLPAGDYCAYEADRDATEDVAAAQQLAKDTDKKALIVMGANWCHDSRALGGHFQTDRFKALLQEHYSLVYVDVGRKNRNLDIARSFGLDGIVGTPTVIIQDNEGEVLNLETAVTWRNSASRTADAIYEELEQFALME